MLRGFAPNMSTEGIVSPQKNNRPISAKARECHEATEDLRRHLKPGVTVWTVLRHVSASRMSRLLDLYVIDGDQPIRLTWSAAKVLDLSYCRKKEALRVVGCGMDMGFHVVNCLSRRVLDDGYALKQRWL